MFIQPIHREIGTRQTLRGIRSTFMMFVHICMKELIHLKHKLPFTLNIVISRMKGREMQSNITLPKTKQK